MDSSKLVWRLEYSVGVTQFDEHHQKLISLIKKTSDLLDKTSSRDDIISILDELYEFTKLHFDSEEDMMVLYQYPYLAEQKRQHAIFTSKVLQLKEDCHNLPSLTLFETLDFLYNWFVNHILVEDKKYQDFFK